jgi:hypothetical protein
MRRQNGVGVGSALSGHLARLVRDGPLLRMLPSIILPLRAGVRVEGSGLRVEGHK